ncbi:ATP-dependent DNA helicase [hydrothermal vent metagenome]|uniref:ATP-dependent DNA helicase n=1 Tax=hydrothermal vent metagenome TaxID=652676 RepID=A0A3B0SH01_9ZZZZ
MLDHQNIVAVLGPTNTGKTHLAIERLLAHKTGMIGLPLRLLAREVYDTVCGRIGSTRVALVTGEEKIIPVDPKYWICTVEAMPGDIAVEFLAVDEVQLCADHERGHVFTDRLLHRRGTSQTMFLGAATVRNVIADLVPSVRFENRSRLSKLTYAGQKKVSRLPARSAIVAFSAEMVYSLAELLRRQRGGAAVVMGSLSPRTRNAQVALYQSGEVDYLVATDAIGMGLNMDIDHIAFAATHKFDGLRRRPLTIAEMGQISGRAGRYKNDGTFGVTARASELDIETIEHLEGHRFEPVKIVQWRNGNLNFATPDHLIASLKAHPNRQGLARSRPAADIQALEILSRDDEIAPLVSAADEVELLWQVCQLPDYRNISAHDHAGIIARIFLFLSKPDGYIDEDWFARQLSFCDKIKGDIDTLSNRISHIRTWTFVANRSNWLKDPVYWQEKARKIEDKLSDALHEALTLRFIDRQTSQLMKRMRQREDFMSTVEQDGSVVVEGETIGKLLGLRFFSNTDDTENSSALKAAAAKTVGEEIEARAASVVAMPDQELTLNDDGKIVWQGAEIGVLSAGDTVLKPKITLLADDYLQTTDRAAVLFRLQKFIDRHIATVLEPLQNLNDDEAITGLARGVAFRVIESLGVIGRGEIADDIKSLDQPARGMLRKHGVRFGAYHIFIPVLLKPAATQLRLLLWALWEEKNTKLDRAKLPEVPGQGLTSSPVEAGAPAAFFQIAGFKVCGGRIVRIDMLERLGDMIRERVFWRQVSDQQKRPEGSIEGGGFSVIADMMSLVGCSGEEFSEILKALGYQAERRPQPPAEEKSPADEKPPAEEKPESPEVDSGSKEQAKPDVETKSDANADPEPGETDKTPDEPQFLEVWWPKNTGPFRQRKPAGKKPPKAAGKPDKKPFKPKHASVRKPRKEIKPEDSPFGALAALKGNLKK